MNKSRQHHTYTHKALGVVVAKAACENFEVWPCYKSASSCFKRAASTDFLSLLVRVCRTHATVHPSHLLAMTVESFLLPVRALGAKKVMTTAGRCLCVNNHHLQSQLDKQHHKPRCNRSTHLVSPPLLEAHLAIKPGNSHLQTS